MDKYDLAVKDLTWNGRLVKATNEGKGSIPSLVDLSIDVLVKYFSNISNLTDIPEDAREKVIPA